MGSELWRQPGSESAAGTVTRTVTRGGGGTAAHLYSSAGVTVTVLLRLDHIATRVAKYIRQCMRASACKALRDSASDSGSDSADSENEDHSRSLFAGGVLILDFNRGIVTVVTGTVDSSHHHGPGEHWQSTTPRPHAAARPAGPIPRRLRLLCRPPLRPRRPRHPLVSGSLILGLRAVNAHESERKKEELQQ
jgi:hypothetical protein